MDKIRQTMDLLEEITGVTYNEPLEWRFPGEKGRLASLDDYFIEILEQKGLKIRICGNCDNYAEHRNQRHFCKMEGAFVKFDSTCVFKSSKWIQKKITVGKK